MPGEDGLYGGSPPYQKHSDTSEDAADEIKAQQATLRALVLAYLTVHEDGRTDEELQIELDMEGNTERPRRRELQLMGLVTDSKRRRPTTKGRDAVVWVITEPVVVAPVDAFLAGSLA